MTNSIKNQTKDFKNLIYNFYRTNKRNFIWRENITPYKIVVSEVMLQQTQTARVIPKFEAWIQRFSSFEILAQASSHEVLQYWQGLGYNRRGLALLKIAQIVTEQFHGILPNDPEILQTFPSIGPNTAGSICAFAFNKPITFIETNIRTVFTHTFFKNQTDIHDKQLLPLIQDTLDHQAPREWYYALMDYGVHLKQKNPRINAASKHYTRQSKFEGSKRQIRGLIIKILTEIQIVKHDDLIELIAIKLPLNKNNPDLIIQDLLQEKIIHQQDDFYKL